MRGIQRGRLIEAFEAEFGVKSRTFGQQSHPHSGVHDDVAGVQWHLVFYDADGWGWIGVNLEGKAYDGWPIASLILNELRRPELPSLRDRVSAPAAIRVHFRRDAWQVTARPRIREVDLGATPIDLADLTEEAWRETLEEALTCLNAERKHRGRATAVVTRLGSASKADWTAEMPVSPHLIVWTRIDSGAAPAEAIRAGRERLEPIHRWMERQAR